MWKTNNPLKSISVTILSFSLLLVSLGYPQDNKQSPPTPPQQTNTSTSNVQFVLYDTPPKPLSPIRPTYPTTAREAKIEGTVIVQCFINEQGKVEDVKVLRGIPGSGIDEASVEAIKKARFSPAMLNGKPVGVWISIPVHFRLE